MKVALHQSAVAIDGGIYFGCREPHLPLELGYTEAMLRQAGHQTLLVDGHLFDRTPEDMSARLAPLGRDDRDNHSAVLLVLAPCSARNAWPAESSRHLATVAAERWRSVRVARSRQARRCASWAPTP